MIKTTMTLSQQAEFGMPAMAAVRPLPMTKPWGGAASAAAAGSKVSFIDTTPVCGYSHITGVDVPKGLFPGTSAWSPPI